MEIATKSRILPLGDSAFTVEFDAPVTPAVTQGILRLARASQDDSALVGVIDVIPSFRSLTVCLDPARAEHAAVQARVCDLQKALPDTPMAARHWTLPACYDGAVAPDLADVSVQTGLSLAEIVDLHSATVFFVYVIGFLPGFPYMGDLPAPLRLPRRTSPHLRVPPGTIAIANEFSCIYPWQSPGGWHLIGATPVGLFDADADQPATLAAGDMVRFDPISLDEFRALEAGGPLDPAPYVSVASP